MSMDIIARGLGAGAVRIAMGHEFDTNTQRDAYFTANPNELNDRIYIRVGNIVQQYVNGMWVDVTFAIKGDQGIPGPHAVINGVPTLEIVAGDNIILEQLSNILTISSSGGGSGTFTNSTATKTTVGGIKAGSTFNEVPLDEMWEKLLYPLTTPTLTNPSSTITLNTDRYVEVGVPNDIRVTTNFSRGSINPAYGTSGFRSGLPQQYQYTGVGIGNISNDALQDVQTISGYIFDSPTDLIISSKVVYLGGEQPKDSDGEDYGAPLSPGTTGAKSVVVSGVYPIFATTNLITEMTRQNLTDSKFLEYTFKAETATNKQSFEWDITFGTLKGVKQYNVLSKEFEYLGNSESASVGYFNVEDITVTLSSGDRTYKKYTYNGNQVGERQLQIFIN